MAQNLLGSVCPVPLTVRGTRNRQLLRRPFVIAAARRRVAGRVLVDELRPAEVLADRVERQDVYEDEEQVDMNHLSKQIR